MKYFLAIFSFVLLASCNSKTEKKPKENTPKEIIIKDFGITFNNYKVNDKTVGDGDTFGTLLENYTFPDSLNVFQVVEKVKDSFDLRKIRKGNRFVVFTDKKDPQKINYFVYVKNKMSYTKISFQDSVFVENIDRPTTIKRRIIAANIEGSLSETLDKNGASAALAPQLAKIYEYSIDFFKIQKNDKFAVSVYEKYIEDTIYAGIEKIDATYFEHKGKKFYAFPHKIKENQEKVDYYDENGKGLKSMFLKAPLDYFRISSRFSGRRFHPVQQRWKAHNGTDYAAAQGTPIKTTAAGVVEKAGYTSGNGNYVKVKHDGTYSTQYLHMSKILVKKGQRVAQGQIIGKVGSTGLATGPHVCYRFWKNGIQVDPLRLKLPNTIPLPKAELSIYLEKIKPLKKEIDDALSKIEIP